MKFKKRILHLVVLPAVLIISDLFIAFMGHFTGSTDEFTWGSFVEYTATLTPSDIAPALFIAVIVLIIVELIIRGE